METTAPVLPTYKIFLLNLTQFGMNFFVILISVIVAPAQMERLVQGSHKGRALGGMVAGGAIATFLACPLIGMLSDRLVCKIGRRRPFMLVGSATLCCGLLGMALSAPEISSFGNPMHKVGSLSIDEKSNVSVNDIVVPVQGVKGQDFQCRVDLVARRCQPYSSGTAEGPKQDPPSYEVGNVAAHAHGVVLPKYANHRSEETEPAGNLGAFITFFMIVVLSQSVITIPFVAMLADITHPSQRGVNSGVMGAMILFGSVSGATAGVSFTHIGVLLTYSMIIAVVIASVLISTFTIKEEVLTPQKTPPVLTLKVFLLGYLEPLKEHDFRWVFITRFFMQQGVSTITGFLEYWVNDVISVPFCWSAATAVSLMLLPLLFAAAMSSLVCGLLSDKTGKRKIIIAVAAFIMAIGSFVDALLSGAYSYYVAALMSFLIGLGFGAFQSVDFALVMDVLWDDKQNAKDIAVWHQALVLPQAIATPLGGVILDFFEKINCRIGLGYVMLFMVACVYFIISGVFVFKIRRAN
ncbi:hypothetical protein BsWGS_06733 [Bradybaena similaris]